MTAKKKKIKRAKNSKKPRVTRTTKLRVETDSKVVKEAKRLKVSISEAIDITLYDNLV